jgi:hypothetical protein
MDTGPKTPREHDDAGREEERRPGVPPHQPHFRPGRDDPVDEELEESFPSSDPPSRGSPGL